MRRVSDVGFATLDDLRLTMKGIINGNKELTKDSYRVSNVGNATARVMNSTLNGQRFDVANNPQPKHLKRYGRKVSVKVTD